MPSRETRHAAFDQLTIFVVFAAPFTAWRAFEPCSATGAGQERATERSDPAPQPEPAAAPLTAKELAEARENARPQVTKNVKPGDTVRK